MRNFRSVFASIMDSTGDPLAMVPSEQETKEQRAARVMEEERARRISDSIDAQIKADKIALKKKKKAIRVLLLGQSESGKSTTIKNFQIAYAYQAWTEERASWRAVVQLNLVRSVNTILDVLTKEMSQSTSPSSPRSIHFPTSRETLKISGTGDSSPSSSGSSLRTQGAAELSFKYRLALTEDHRGLRSRLQPLQRVQQELETKLGSASSEVTSTNVTTAVPFMEQPAHITVNGISEFQSNPNRPREFFVRSNIGWKAALDKVRPKLSINTRSTEDLNEKFEGSAQSEACLRKRSMKRRRDIGDEITDVITDSKDDIKALWTDDVIRGILLKRKMRLEDASGFFLDDIDRIATRDYEPSDDDVVRARLRTLGVQEHHLKFERGSEKGREWVLYDVGGSRSCRAAWYPFFDDVNAIIFLAPISCFDESLVEDRRVNRLDDSLLLWKGLCSCPLLTNVQLIIFLNKYDLLERKLSPSGGGVYAADYIPGYGNRPNDAQSVASFFRQKFGELLKQHSPEPRGFYAFITSAVNTKETSLTLDTVREGILRRYLKEADLAP
ncbi:G-alpha-domain-containing protein [Neolentinus lepideus HHB14362 ss-1]|uniref:G-alpha-domain-containing protein n=1 Tax=Neolentinus lepideus HHB14362 ss-1 TaxID=1314782 RepID=A0A165RS78_9AGAM|nr:G-alpha-domain-containing protein [Neolentinus lepideus HHB14362 ss-1]